MLCLIAAEQGTADSIKVNLEKSGLFPGWEWTTCNTALEMDDRSRKPPDVLVVSRFLPCNDMAGLLKSLKMVFPSSHIILLAGGASEQQRAFIKAAHRNGLYNIVTGTLPGDRPYTIFTALRRPRNPEQDGLDGVADPDEPEKDEEWQKSVGLPGVDGAFRQDKAPPEEAAIPDVKGALAGLVQTAQGTANQEAIRDKLWELISLLENSDTASGTAAPAMQRTSYGSKGVVVLSSANKGGVGKTTVSTTLAVALSRAGVPTVLADFDLGAPDVASLLGIKGVPGIEALAERTVRENALRDLIVKKDTLDVLPGPMNGTLPSFQQGQLLKVVNTLAEMYAVVVCDTAPEYWTKPWLPEIFARADRVLAVVDQSVLSERDTESYAPYLLSMGVTPEKIGIVLNRYSPRLHNPRTVERIFCSGFKKGVKELPRVVAVIPEDWTAHVQKGYKGEVVGLEDWHSQWHRLAEEIARMAGYGYEAKTGKGGLLARFKKGR